MNYYLKRYFYGISKRRLLFLLIFLLPVIYLLLSAISVDRFTIKQTISLSENDPVALLSKPVGYILLKDIIASPDTFFQNSFALNRLSNRLSMDSDKISGMIKNNISIAVTGKSQMAIQYFGDDSGRGEVIVDFFSKRMLKGAKEGIERSNMLVAGDGMIPSFSGGLYIIEHRALWRKARFLPMAGLFMVSFIGVLMLLGIMEWSDSSFKSERQVGRYLNLPVIGTLPDIEKVSNMVVIKEEVARTMHQGGLGTLGGMH